MRTPRPSPLRSALSVLFVLLLLTLHLPAKAQTANVAAATAERAVLPPIPQARITQAIDEENRVVLHGNQHPLARPEFDRGAVADAQPLNRILLLLQRSPDQEARLEQFLDDQQNKSSPNYHAWLTPDQFGKQYGVADSDIQAVADWLFSHGFTQIKVSPGRAVIEFSGNVAQVRNALHTQIRHFMVNGAAHIANANDPQIPAALSPVIAGVVSLNNFPVRSHVHRLGTFQKSSITGETKPLFTFPGCQSGNCYAVGPPDFAVIYNTQPLLTGTPKIDGTGQTIAIIGESNINVQDVADFRTIFGLPQNFTTQNVILNGPDPGLTSSETESDLDIEWAGAAAPGASIAFVTSAPTETTSGVHLSALYAVDNNVAGVLSESFGSCEQALGTVGNQFYNSLWQQAAAQGITVILSAGDGGSAGCDDFNTQQTASQGLAVSGLASTPFNVAIGGTDFDQSGRQSQFWNTSPTTTTPPVPASALKYIPEVPWNDSCAQLGLAACGASAPTGSLNILAGSGGASSIYSKPTWQIGVPGVPNDGHRDLPDVSLFASNGFNDSFYIICQRNASFGAACNLNNLGVTFQGAGGTSAAAPAFAGIMALVNQTAGSRQGNANYVLYALAKGPGASCNSNGSTPPPSTCIFNDVTKGSNSVPCAAASLNCSSKIAGINGVLVEPNSPSTPAFPAIAGYDLATGLGSLNAQNLVKNWNSVRTVPTSTTLVLKGGGAVNVVHGSPVPVSITVAPSTATGNVSLLGAPNGSSIGMGSFTLTGGVATGSTSSLAGGSYSVTAHYAGDATNAPSDSPGVPVIVTPESSKVFITVPTFDPVTGRETGNLPTTLVYGSPYILRVDVTNAQGSLAALCTPPNCPTGTVTVTDTIGGVSQGPPNTGIFTLNSTGFTEDLPVQFPGGTNVITATYPGDSSFSSPSQPTSYTLTVTPLPTAMSVPYLPFSPALVGQPIPLSAFLVTNLHAGAPPLGTITFYDGGTPIPGPVSLTSRPGSSALDASVAGSMMATFTSSGTHSITAKYNGDPSYTSSTSSPWNASVLWPTTTTQTASLTNINYGQSITVTAQTTASSQGPPITGQFRFFGSYTAIPSPITPVLSTDAQGNQVLTASVTTTPQANEVIQGGYTGDANYQGSGAATFINVIVPDFSVAPSPSSLTLTAGQSGTATLAIAPLSAFSSTVVLTCSLPLLMGASCTVSPTSVNLQNNASASATLTLTTLPPSSTNTAESMPNVPTRWASTLNFWRLIGACSFFAILLLLALPGRKQRRRLVLALAPACVVAFVVACGGGSSGAGISGAGSGPGAGGPGSNLVPTSVTVTSSTTKVAQGATITLTASVTSSKPVTGSVIFWEQNNSGALAPNAIIVNGVAQAQARLAFVGTHQVYAQYIGDAQNQASQSGNLNIVATGSAFIQLSGTTASLTHNVPFTVTVQ